MRPPTRPFRVNHLGDYTRNARKTVQFWTEVRKLIRRVLGLEIFCVKN